MVEIFETTDAAGSHDTRFSIDVGQFFKGNISNSLDVDFVKIHLRPGTYSFGLIGTSHDPLIDPVIRLSGTQRFGRLQLPRVWMDNNSGPKLASSLKVDITQEADYFIEISGFAGSTGQYKLSASTGPIPSFDTEMGAASINGYLDPLYHKWNANQGQSRSLTYSFNDLSGPTPPNSSRVSEAQKAAIIETMNNISEICDVHFELINQEGFSAEADIVFGNYSGDTNLDYSGGSTNIAPSNQAFIWLNTRGVDINDASPGTRLRESILHETLHSLGLTHPGDYNAYPLVQNVYGHDNSFVEDTKQFTVMSYFSGDNTGQLALGQPYSPALFDIFALQQIFGANLQTRTEDTTYGFQTNAGAFFEFKDDQTPNPICIWDAGGADFIDASLYSEDQLIDLHAEKFSNIGGGRKNISIATGVVIEGARGGSGNDTIFGNDAANIVEGGHGDDIISTFAGNDTFEGYVGKDLLDGGEDYDVIELKKDLVGFVPSTFDINQASDLSIKNIEEISMESSEVGRVLDLSRQTEGFKINGSDNNDYIIGSKGNDFIKAGSGEDRISGYLGKDRLFGGDSFDYFKFSPGDSVWNNYDTILDFGKSVISASPGGPSYIPGDTIDYSAPLTIGGSSFRPSSGQASIDQITGIASFTTGNEASDVRSAATQITARFDNSRPLINTNLNTAGDYAFFKIKGNENFFLFVSDGVRGLGTNDLVIELAGITTINKPLANSGNIWIS